MTRPEHDDHDEYDGLAVGWALHALEPEEEEAFAGHLATCSRCQATVQESEEALGELAQDVPLVDPPSRVLNRIRAAVADDTAPHRLTRAPVAVPSSTTQAPRLRRWAAGAMAAAIVLIALLSWNVVLRNQAADARRVAAQRQEVISRLAGSSTRAALQDDANRTVGYVEQRGADLQVLTTGLAPNDRTRSTYVLWGIQGSGRPPLAVGTFDVLRAGTDVRPVLGRAPLAGFSGFSVSREPGRTAPDRPSAVVASGAAI